MAIDFSYFNKVVFNYLIGSFSDFVFVDGTLHNKKSKAFVSCSVMKMIKNVENSSVKTFVKSY